MILLLAIVFILLLILGVPIAFALVAAAVVAMAAATPFSLEIIVQRMVGGVNSFPLVAIPFFVLAGLIMGKGGMSKRLIAFARNLVGGLPAGLALVMVLASMMFAAISGSTAATTATIGAVMIPALARARGFNIPSAAALQTTAGCIGVIIPPSVPLILMGVIAGISVGDLFLAGVFPGILMGITLMVTSVIYSLWRRGEGAEESGSLATTPGELGRSALHAILPLLTLVIIMGGIIGGLFTPTEAGIVAVIYAVVICAAVYRELRWKDFPELLREAVVITAVVVLCISAAAPFAWLLTIEQVPQQIGQAMLAITESRMALIGLMLLVLILIGTFLDLTPAMLILVPVFLPIARAIGMPDLQFGLMVTMSLAIGQCTPPLGVSLFVACGVAKCRIGELVRPLLPFLAALLVALLVTAFFPLFSTWLPAVLKD
jgi:C4-dicarboxylate transporter, DctM subunit